MNSAYPAILKESAAQPTLLHQKKSLKAGKTKNEQYL
mgnify:CR=1 FL=1